MARKINFLAIVLFFILLVLIANAAEETTNESYNLSNGNNENSSYNIAALKEDLANETLDLNSSDNNISNTLELSTNNSEHKTNIENITIENSQTNEYNADFNNTYNTTYNKTEGIGNSQIALNDSLEIGYLTTEENKSIDEALINDSLTASSTSQIKESIENKNEGKAVTASFGVYLEIVG